eukprot:TRINITY_DN33197_c0_g1_i1.p1 TRINITY_DN33197_c0_g1~~TRINITY_DN33197_c0_g1_i1.p1  ORF type:complete len:447 (-),score=67.78 TRINITY_DN33197_c0_g1_i1:189-1529(-)
MVASAAAAFASLVLVQLGEASATKCDDILKDAFADICDFRVQHGSIAIRGLHAKYWKYTSVNWSNNSKLPILMVHGGPAWSHQYMLPLKQQACRGREVVFYDQVGAGESSKPADPQRSAPWLFTIDYYVEELQALVDHLGWSAFHFVGNSWGTIIGQKYGFLQDPRLQSLVLSGPLSDAQLYIQSQWDQRIGSLGSLPLSVQHRLQHLEAERAYDSASYEELNTYITPFFTSRTVPLADCLLKAVANLDSDVSKSIYVGMQGHSEFSIGGVLGSMNLTGRLPQISVPVLLTHGRYDTMRPPVVEVMRTNIPRAWRAEMPRSGHASMIDDPLLMNNVVGEFLDRVEVSGKLDSFTPWLASAVDAMAGGPGAGSTAGPFGSSAVMLAVAGWQNQERGGSLMFTLNQGILLVAVGFLTGVLGGRSMQSLFRRELLLGQGLREPLKPTTS